MYLVSCTHSKHHPRIYGTPKIHKDDTLLRPIVDSIGSVTYNLSKAPVEIIKHILGLREHHRKNSRHLTQELKDLTVNTDEILISHDVISLFTKKKEHVKKDRTLKSRTNLTADDIHRLLQFAAKSTYFQFKETIYRQKEGFALGDPSLPS